MKESPRCLYHSIFKEFLCEDENAILGLLCDHYHGDASQSRHGDLCSRRQSAQESERLLGGQHPYAGIL